MPVVNGLCGAGALNMVFVSMAIPFLRRAHSAVFRGLAENYLWGARRHSRSS